MAGPRHTPFVAIADDDTGATDLGDMIAEKGVPTTVFIDVPSEEVLARYADSAEAVIVATRSRSIAPDAASARVAAALERLRPLQPRIVQLKICATFDSTAEGNIGPSADAAMDALGLTCIPVVPALPINGRTTYMGHQFVGEQLLSDSPLKDHPLNPMRQSNLVDWLGRQTRRKVGLANLHTVRQGPECLHRRLADLAQSGYGMVLIDAIAHEDLAVIAEAIEACGLLVGSSGIGGELAQRLYPDAAPARPLVRVDDAGAFDGSVLVIAGSCSQRTRQQNTYAQQHGYCAIHVDARALLADDDASRSLIDDVSRHVVERLTAGVNVLVLSSNDDAAVAEAQQSGRERGLSLEQVGLVVSDALTAVATAAVARAGLRKLIVAGGETAGQICRGLGIAALEAGGRIDPGVPWCLARGHTELAVVLKSGGFGSEDFFPKASAQLDALGIAPT